MTQRERIIAIACGSVLGLLLLDQVIIAPLFERLNRADRDVDDFGRQIKSAEAADMEYKHEQAKWKEITKPKEDGTQPIKIDAPSAETDAKKLIAQYRDELKLPAGTLSSEQPDAKHGFQRIPITVTTSGKVADLRAFVYKLRTAPIALAINQLSLTTHDETKDNVEITLKLSTIYDSNGQTPPVQR